MNITVNQPAQPSPARSRLQAVHLPPSNASKTVEKIIAFAICLPTKIDASRFSGPEQFFAGAPYISLQKSNVVFSTPNRPMPMPRSIAVLENDRNGRKNLLLPHHSDTRDAVSSHWHPRAMVAALASACLVFHWVLVVLFRSPLYRDLTEIEILPRAGRVGCAQAKR